MRAELLHAAVEILNEDGPDALQTRKIAGAAGTSTMAVYTHFGGMPALIAAVAEEGLRQFDAAMTMPPTSDPVADLMATGIAYRRYAIERPHMYRLMFGSTSAHGINAPAHDVLTLTLAEINDHYPSFAHVVRGVHRCMLAGRIAAGSALRRRHRGGYRRSVLGVDPRLRDARTRGLLRRAGQRRRAGTRCVDDESSYFTWRFA